MDLVDKSDTPLSTIARHYLTTCQTEGKTPKTLRGYREKLLRFVRWFDDGCLQDLTLEKVRQFIGELQRTEKWDDHPFTPSNGDLLSPTTVSHYARILKGFATWLHEEGYTADNLLTRLAIPKEPRRIIEVLSTEEVSQLLSAIDSSHAVGSRDIAIVVLLLDTGLRLAELVSIQLADVHLEDQWLKVMGKGQKERLVPFGARAAKTLIRYVSLYRPTTYGHPGLFLTRDGEPIGDNTIKMLFTRLRKKSGITRLHPHLLRHTFATSYLVAGGDVFTLQSILGHTTLEMTRRYVTLASSHVNIQHRRFSPMDRMWIPSRSGRGAVAAGPKTATLATTQRAKLRVIDNIDKVR